MEPQTKRKLLIFLLIVGFLSILFFFLYLIYRILLIFLPSLISYVVLFYLTITFVRLIINFLVFPGSFWLWRRNIENQFSKAISKKTLLKLKKLNELILGLLRQGSLQQISAIDLKEVRRALETFVETFQTLSKLSSLNRRQEKLSLLFTELIRVMKEVRVKHQQENSSLYELLMKRTNMFFMMIRDADNEPEFEFKTQGELLMEVLGKIEQNFKDNVAEVGRIKGFNRWMFNNSLGTIDQMRVELGQKFHCKRLLLCTADKATLDCLLVYPNAPPEQENNIATEINTLLIFCNPNAGYYEYMYYETEWIEFYTTKGITLFLWNYRGYGKSTGAPSPQNLQSDSDFLFEYIQNELRPKFIGIHGTSLGGLVATYLASSKKLDFMIADRTFSSVSAVARLSFGRSAQFFLHLLMNFDQELSGHYLHSNCYKVLIYDPRDEIIHLLGSLYCGVVKEYFLKQRNALTIGDSSKEDGKKNSKWYQRVLGPFFEKIQTIKRIIRVEKTFNNCFEANFFTKQEIANTCKVLKRLSRITLEILTSTRARFTLREAHHGSFEEEENIEEKTQFSIYTGLQTLEQDPGTDYQELLGEKTPEIISLACEIFKCFENVEAGGLKLWEVFTHFRERNEETLKCFLLALEHWGASIHSMKQNLSLQQSQKLALSKLREAILGLDVAMKVRESKKEAKSAFESRFLSDVGILLLFLKKTLEKSKKPVILACNNNVSNRICEDKADLGIISNKEFERSDLILPKSRESNEFQGLTEDVGSYFGHLIAVNTGHNGCLAEEDNAKLEAYLKEAGIMK